MAERSPQPMPPERVLQKFNGRLYNAMQSPQALAEFLYAEELIGDDVINDLPSMTVNERKSKLLSALRSAIRGSDHKEVIMSKIFLALERAGEPPLKEVVSDMRAFFPGWPIVCMCLYFMSIYLVVIHVSKCRISHYSLSGLHFFSSIDTLNREHKYQCFY